MSETSTDATTAKDTTASGQGADGQVNGQGTAGDTTTQTTQAQTTDGAPANGTQTQTDASATTTGDTKADAKPDAKPEVPPSPVKLTLPEGEHPSDMAKWFEGVANKMGLTQEAAQGVYESWMEVQKNNEVNQAKMRTEAETALKAVWQRDYAANLAIAQRTLKAYAPASLLERLESSGFANDAEFARMLHSIGVQVAEDHIRTGENKQLSNATAASKLYPSKT